MRYDPLTHSLREARVKPDAWRAFRRDVARAAPKGRGTMILLVADSAATAARYDHCESLVYRDAGCMIATIQLTAGALGMSCIPIGFKGEGFVDALRLDRNRFFPCGILSAGQPSFQKANVRRRPERQG